MNVRPARRHLRGCPREGGGFAAASVPASSELMFLAPAVRSRDVYVVNRRRSSVFLAIYKKNYVCYYVYACDISDPPFPRKLVRIYVFVLHSEMVQRLLTSAELLQEQLMSGMGLDFVCLFVRAPRLLNFSLRSCCQRGLVESTAEFLRCWCWAGDGGRAARLHSDGDNPSGS